MGRCEVTQQECLGHTNLCHTEHTKYDDYPNNECVRYIQYKGENFEL